MELGICCSTLIGTASTITTYLPFCAFHNTYLSVPSTNPNASSAVRNAAIDSYNHNFFQGKKKDSSSRRRQKYSWLQLINVLFSREWLLHFFIKTAELFFFAEKMAELLWQVINGKK
jgi:hypothetical protein